MRAEITENGVLEESLVKAEEDDRVAVQSEGNVDGDGPLFPGGKLETFDQFLQASRVQVFGAQRCAEDVHQVFAHVGHPD